MSAFVFLRVFVCVGVGVGGFVLGVMVFSLDWDRLRIEGGVLMDISKGAFFMGLSDILMIRDRDEHEICWNEK